MNRNPESRPTMSSQILPQDLEQFFAELRSLVRGGIPLPEGLRTLASESHSEAMRQLAGALQARLEAGESLADAMRSLKPRLPEPVIAAVACGEKSGSMEATLDFALQHTRRMVLYRSAILTSTLYPVLVLVVLAIIGSGYGYTMLSNFGNQPNQIKPGEVWAESPAFQAMIRASAGTAVLAIAALLALLLPGVRQWLYTTMQRLPGVREVAALADADLMMRFVGTMLRRGVPLPDSLRAAGNAVLMPQFRRSIAAMGDAAEQGRAIAPLLPGLVPATAAYLFRQAEERGDLPDACFDVADFCRDRYERLSQRMLTLVEPLLLLIVGIVVAVLVLSYLQLPQQLYMERLPL